MAEIDPVVLALEEALAPNPAQPSEGSYGNGQTCKSCRFWNFPDEWQRDGRHAMYESFPCARHPPVLVQAAVRFDEDGAPSDMSLTAASVWPRTYEFDRCGEWRPLPSARRRGCRPAPLSGQVEERVGRASELAAEVGARLADGLNRISCERTAAETPTGATALVTPPPDDGVRIRVLPDGRVSRADAAKFLGFSPSTLANWGSKGIGPKPHKLGRVFYYICDLEAFRDTGAREA